MLADVQASLRCEIFPVDLTATVTFYCDVLGFTIISDERDTDHPYVWLGRDGVRIGAAARPGVPDRESRRPPTGVELVLDVDDLLAERSRVAAAGWPVDEDLTHRPWGLIDFRLLDPDGYYWRVTGGPAAD